jgi:vacuolar-type H+-ATPase subunit H
MTVTATETDLGLAPLQASLLALAHAQADALVETARADGDAAVTRARDHVGALLSEARRQGEADGSDVLAAERTQARRATRGARFGAERAVYDELLELARHTVADLLDRPGNRDRLAAALRSRLGGDAQVTESRDGGLLARAREGRTIDASAAALAASAVGALDLEPLWAPG